jgi:hypothetical protein
VESIRSKLARAWSWIMKPSGTERRLLDRKLDNVTTEWDKGMRAQPRQSDDKGEQTGDR